MFEDRKEAGKELASKLGAYKDNKEAIVLGLARGGIVTAYEVAQSLNLPLDILTPRKIGFPGDPELAIGAVSEDGSSIINEEMVTDYNIDKKYIEEEKERQRQESLRRMTLYRGDRPALNLTDKVAILVDDGIATGTTMRAAIKSAKFKKAKRVVVAIPVTEPSALKVIEKEVDDVVYLAAPTFFMAVGQFYQSFPPVEDDEVIKFMVL